MLVIFLSQNKLLAIFLYMDAPAPFFPWVRPWVEFVRNGAKVILTDIPDDLGRASQPSSGLTPPTPAAT